MKAMLVLDEVGGKYYNCPRVRKSTACTSCDGKLPMHLAGQQSAPGNQYWLAGCLSVSSDQLALVPGQQRLPTGPNDTSIYVTADALEQQNPQLTTRPQAVFRMYKVRLENTGLPGWDGVDLEVIGVERGQPATFVYVQVRRMSLADTYEDRGYFQLQRVNNRLNIDIACAQQFITVIRATVTTTIYLCGVILLSNRV